MPETAGAAGAPTEGIIDYHRIALQFHETYMSAAHPDAVEGQGHFSDVQTAGAADETLIYFSCT